MTSSEMAVMKTLCYADVFNYPLTASEVYRYLIASKPQRQSQINTALERLIAKGGIDQQKGYYFLAGNRKLVNLRLKRHQISQEKISLAHKISSSLTPIPSLSAVFVTGALAMENTTNGDDIDLLIITKHHNLWLTRLIVTMILDKHGIRRKPSKTSNSVAPNLLNKQQLELSNPAVKDLVCPNMYLDESALTVPVSKRNLYTAHEVIQAKPIYDPTVVHHRFLVANTWVLNYLPHAFSINLAKINTPPKQSHSVVNSLDRLAYWSQRLYMLRHRTNESVTRSAAYFHPRNTKSQVLTAYQKRLKTVLKNST